MQNGFIALLDVLGFAAVVSDEREPDQLRKYLECLTSAMDPDNRSPVVDYVVFSDSIVLTVPGESEASLQALIRRSSRLFGMMLEVGIALRGAIAYGSYLRVEGPGGVFVAGKPIIEAYRYQAAQDWVGIMLAPSAVSQMPNLETLCRLGSSTKKQDIQELKQRIQWAAFVQAYAAIPFHNESAFETEFFDGLVVVPTDGTHEAAKLRDSIRRSIAALKQLKSIAPNPSAQRKYSRSIDFLDRVVSNWASIADYWYQYTTPIT